MDFRLSYSPQQEIRAIELPGSKSVTNRALIINALSQRPARIEGIAHCDDTIAITDALKQCDCARIDIGAAGTAMRFLTAYFAAMPGVSLTLTGTQRMLCRPIKPLVDSLMQLDADIAYLGEDGFPPLCIEGKRLKGGNISIRGDISSQFISALMMIGPTLNGGLNIQLLGEVVSRSYIDMTCEIMRHYGIEVKSDENIIAIPEQSYSAPDVFMVEADWSSASYFYELVALTDMQNIKLTGLFSPQHSVQGDSALAHLFNHFGVQTSFNDDCAVISSGKRNEMSDEVLCLNLSTTPDIVPTMVVTACLKGRHFHFCGIHNLRVKESDRIAALTAEMRRLGYVLHSDFDSIGWKGERCTSESSPIISTYSDHRMAMAFAPAATIFPGLCIADVGVVNKSFPKFWTEMRKLGIISEGV